MKTNSTLVKSIAFFTLIFIANLSFCQLKIDAKVHYEELDDGVNILVDNNEVIPLTLITKYKLTNVKSSAGKQTQFVIPPNSTDYLIAELRVINRKKKTKFHLESEMVFGDDPNQKHDKQHLYYLPFEPGKSFKISQGYNGSFSHSGEKALDFDMPVGTPVLAAREGIVVKAVDNNRRKCAKKKCAKYNNYIIIYHSDGSMGEYVHIKQGSAKVKIGDKVKPGQLLALSGNVGYTSGPHLHFAVFSLKGKNRNTVRTKFLIDDGEKSKYLQAKSTYSRNY